jgi:hypothetical protein
MVSDSRFSHFKTTQMWNEIYFEKKIGFFFYKKNATKPKLNSKCIEQISQKQNQNLMIFS